MNKHKIESLIFWGILCLFPSAGFAQACCSGGTPLAGSLGLQSMPAGSGLIELNYDYNTQHDLISRSSVLEDNPRHRNTHSLLLRGVYAFSDKTALFTIFSLVRQEEVIERANSNKGVIGSLGIGDAIVFGQYTLLDHADRQILLGGGIKIPIGSISQIDSETGLPLHPDLQPGTGSWDFLLGTNFTWQHVLVENLHFTTNLTYRLTTPADRYRGRQKYEFGDELRLLSGFSGSYGSSSGIWSPSLLLLYRFTQVDRTNDFRTPNTGGHWVHLRPGLGLAFNPKWSIQVFGEWPLFRNLEGTQLTTTTRFRLSVAHHFSRRTQLEEPIIENDWKF